MLVAFKHHNPVVVELRDQISVRTAIAQENHPALRSGFAGYPANPRWNVAKYRAWKVGRQLRDDLARGVMVVRPSDRLLIPAAEAEETSDEKPPSTFTGQSNLPSARLGQGNLKGGVGRQYLGEIWKNCR